MPGGPKHTPIPEAAHPLVHQLFNALREQGMSGYDLEKQSGVSRRAVWHWRFAGNPGVYSFERCARVLGYRLALVPVEEADA